MKNEKDNDISFKDRCEKELVKEIDAMLYYRTYTNLYKDDSSGNRFFVQDLLKEYKRYQNCIKQHDKKYTIDENIYIDFDKN